MFGAFIDMTFLRVVITVILGDLTACTIMTILSYFCAEYISVILAVVFAIVIVAILYFIIRVVYKAIKKSKQPQVEEAKDEKIDG